MIEEAVKLLQCGKIAIFPTETVYALVASALNPQAINKIYQIKQRPSSKYLPVIFAKVNDIFPFVELSAWQEAVIRKLTPGPVTFIVRKKANSALKIYFAEKIAIRIPACAIILKVLNSFKKPIVATSLNISGKKALANANFTHTYFHDEVSIVLTHKQLMSSKPSTIIDISNNMIKLIRKGELDLENADYLRNIQR